MGNIKNDSNTSKPKKTVKFKTFDQNFHPIDMGKAKKKAKGK